MKWRLLLAAICFFLCWGASPSFHPEQCSAQSAKKRIQKNKAKRDMIYEQVRILNAKKGALSDEVGAVEDRITGKEKEIGAIRKQLAEAEGNKAALEGQRAALADSHDNRVKALGQRMRAIYIEGDLGYVDLLFNSASFSELIDRVYYVQAICESDEKLIQASMETQVLVAEKIGDIAAAIRAIEEMKEQLQVQYDELSVLRDDKVSMIDAIDNDKALCLRQIKELEAENNRIRDSIRALGGSASSYKGKPWSGSFLKPCAGEIRSGFGRRKHPIFGITKMHTGVDIANVTGTTVKAAGDGKVIKTGYLGGYGNAIIVDHGGNRTTLYGHLSSINCEAGQVVKAGTKIGEVGSTGFSTGPHLHFEVRINGDPVDPMKEL